MVAQSCVLFVVFRMVAGATVALPEPTMRAAAAVLACVVVVALTGPVYRIAWTIGRTRSAAMLLGHTTPTRLFRRYREPGTDLRDM